MSRTSDPRWQRTRTRLSEVRRSCTELLHRFAEDPAHATTAEDAEARARGPESAEDQRPGDGPSRAPQGQGVFVDLGFGVEFVPRSRALQDVEVSA